MLHQRPGGEAVRVQQQPGRHRLAWNGVQRSTHQIAVQRTRGGDAPIVTGHVEWLPVQRRDAPLVAANQLTRAQQHDIARGWAFAPCEQFLVVIGGWMPQHSCHRFG